MYSMRSVVVYSVIVAMALGPIGCQTAPPPDPPKTRSEALQLEIERAQAIESGEYDGIRGKEKLGPEDQIDQWLRAASMALDAEEDEKAREMLVEVTGKLSALVGTESFHKREGKALRTVGGEESDKFFIGDPYEQLFAYLYLGVLDFQAGDYEYARAAFKSAALADEVRVAAKYRGDCYLAEILEGVASVALTEQDLAQSAFAEAQRTFTFRQRLPILNYQLVSAVTQLRAEYDTETNAPFWERFDCLFPLVSEELARELAANPQNPDQVLADTFDAVTSAITNADRSVAELDTPLGGLMALGGKQKRYERQGAQLVRVVDSSGWESNKRECLQLLSKFEEAVVANPATDLMAAADESLADFDRVLATCSDPATNTFILHEIGTGPTKTRHGKYGQTLKFRGYENEAERFLFMVYPDGQDQPVWASLSVLGESIDYQARTRGGREMDSILEGKASFRDAMKVTSSLAATGASAAMVAGAAAASAMVTTTTVTYTVTSSGTMVATTTTSTAPAGMAAAGPYIIGAVALLAIYKGAKILADHTHPEADIRGWHELPSRLMMTCGTLPPGEYRLVCKAFDRLGKPISKYDRQQSFIVSKDAPALILSTAPWN